MLHRAEEASKAGLGDMMIMQKLPIPLSDFTVAPPHLTGGHASHLESGSESGVSDLEKFKTKTDDKGRIKYTIGVFRRS